MNISSMKKPLIAMAVALIALVANGCATLTGANQAAAAAVNGGIELITSLYIQHKGNNNAADEAKVAQNLVDVSKQLQGVVTGNLTIAQFNAAVAKYIASLSPTQQILATEVLTQLDVYFAQQAAAQGSLITVATQAAANIVFSDIIAAASFYIQAPAAIKTVNAPCSIHGWASMCSYRLGAQV